MLPVFNNLVTGANSAANKAAMQAVNTIVLSEATEDTVVYPYVSESFGGYAFQANKTNPVTYLFNDTEHSAQWNGDLLGLRTRYETAPTSLVFTSFVGDHLRFSDAYWNDVIIPYLQ